MSNMFTTLTISGCLMLVASAGFAQQGIQAQRVPARLQHAGVYHVATGTWSHTHDTLQPPEVYYLNSANTGFYGPMGQAIDMIWTDEGNIPSSGHVAGAQDGSMVVQALDFAYCSTVLGAFQNIGFVFYNSYASCTDPIGQPSVASLAFSVPGGGSSGTNCWLVTFDLTGSADEFNLDADAGVFDGATALDNFGWTLLMNDQGAGGFNGPLLNGDPNNFPSGDGTYYQMPGATVATGLDTQDQFWFSDPSSTIANGCYWFFGYAGGNPFASFWLSIQGKPSGGIGTKYCIATPNSTGLPADISASGVASEGSGGLMLSSAPVPNQPSIFFNGRNSGQVPNFFDGFLCATQDLVRSAVVFGAGNLATYTYDNSDNKHRINGNPIIHGSFIGQTRYFQHWYRDSAAGLTGANTSNGVAILIVP